MKKSILLLVFFLCIINFSCITNQNTNFSETWYSLKDTVISNFEIDDIDSTSFQNYNNLILKDTNKNNFYFVLVNKQNYLAGKFKGKKINLKLKKLPCNYSLMLKPRSKIDIIYSHIGGTVLWIYNRVVVDAFELIE